MLSIVVYGRNDNHGYNLHKRAALSLNAIAETLTCPEDEIIFVDYNTPDEIPTFPEAIADTLTAKAQDKLRIIRVRPSFHRQFTDKTRLVALEPQARNIGIRRANPANRWVLSTNTDMVFVPALGRSLSAEVADLEDGFYHLPRFEAPEGFWESLDRKDPATAIEAFREWGKRYHLNEVVYGDFDNLYEAPGDFQLFMRSDLDRIHGFDESMVLGWHVDSNVARRMRLLRGEVRTLEDRLLGYHCGHTRQATIYHGHSRTENSLDIYCRNLAQHDIPSQAEIWGAPDQDFEEFGLAGRKTKYFSALAAAMPEGADKTYAGRLPDDAPATRDYYDSDHVLPYLCDLLSALPADARVLFLGTDLRLAQGMQTFLSHRAPQNRVMFASNWTHPAGAMAQDGELLSFADAVAEADAFVLQFPESRLGEPRAEERWRAQESIERLAEIERGRPRSERRRIIVVNANDNPLQLSLDRTMSYTMMPYTCRLRHGYVLDAEQSDIPAVQAGTSEANFAKRLKRDRAFSSEEQAFLVRAATTRGTASCAIELDALAHEPIQAAAWSVDVERLPQLRDWASSEIAKVETRLAAPSVSPPPRLEATTRLCSGTDWENAEWRHLLTRGFYGAPYSILHRTRWIWERIALMAAVEKHLAREERPWILVTGHAPDVLPALLAMRGYRVAYCTQGELDGTEAPSDWAPRFEHVQGMLSPDIYPLHALPSSAGARTKGFDAIVVYENALLQGTASHTTDFLARLDRFSGKQTFLLCTLAVRLDRSQGGGALSYTDWQDIFKPHGVFGGQGFTLAGDADFRIPLDAAMKFSNDDIPGEIPGLSFGSDGVLASVGIVSARWPKRFGIPAPAAPSLGNLQTPKVSLPFPMGGTASTVLVRARNILPHVQSPNQVLRTANTLEISTTEEVVRFGANLDLAQSQTLKLVLAMDLKAPPLLVELSSDQESIAGVLLHDHSGQYVYEFRAGSAIGMAELRVALGSTKASLVNVTVSTRLDG